MSVTEPDNTDESRPGEFPFLRGIHAEMYQRKLWTMRQYSGFGGPRETNARFRAIIAAGGTGLSLAFDLPTQLGLDSDHPLSRGEVGRTGVAIDTVDDMAAVFTGIDLGAVSTSMTINAPAAVLLVFYLLAAERMGIPAAALRGTVQNDILKEYVARGTYIYPPAPSLRLIADLFAFAVDTLAKFNVISVSGYHIREAGATAAQELAFTLANGRAYMRRLLDAGQDVNRVGRQMSFFFSVDNGFFEEIAKFRAARVLWAGIMRDEFGADDEACRLRFHCQTAGSTLTAQQPDNNVVRVTLQALAAVLGGAQSLHTNARDEAIGLPTEAAAQLALRTQQIIACESNVPAYVDPLGGADAVEALTRQTIEQVRNILQRIEQHGGMLGAVESGVVKQWIQESAYQRQRGIEHGAIQIVGVNCYQDEAAPPAEQTLRIDPALEAQAVQRLAEHRARRDGKRCHQALAALTNAARGSENLVPFIVAAARTDATVGEISAAMKQVFGEHQPGGSI